MITQDLAHALVETHPLEAARILERLEPREVVEELGRYEEELRAPVLEWFSPDFAARVLQELPPEEAAALVRELPSEDTNDILEYLPESDRQAVLERLPSAHAEELEELAEYEEDTAGSLMSPEYVALREGATVADALTRLRRLALVGRDVNYVYVVDEERVLKGVLLMRDLVLNLPRTPLSRVMVADVLRVYTGDPQGEVRDALLERNLLSVPVVDDRERRQEDLEPERHARPEHRNRRERERDVGRHRDGPAVETRAPPVEKRINQCRDEHSPERRGHPQGGLARARELARHQLPLELQTDQQEKIAIRPSLTQCPSDKSSDQPRTLTLRCSASRAV